MYFENKIWIANNDKDERISILPRMANRHGLIAGATGTGKTVTLKVMAEAFSDMGVPVFLADVKGDVAGLMAPGEDSENMQERIARFGLAEAGFTYRGYPVTLWDIYGQKGIQVRTTVTEIGPLLLSRILKLNDLQTDILSIIYKIADDNGLLLVDTKDLKAILAFVEQNADAFAADYGRIASSSIGAITRAVVALELEGGDTFFGEPALNLSDWLSVGEGGRGMLNILTSDSLINNGRMYSTFLLWFLSELFENLPEVGDLDKPKMVFFFDEAHLLFSEAGTDLLEKIEQVVKLIRSKGVGVYFCTQNPRDIPDSVLAQLGNKVQHGLRAYTPAEQKAVRAAAESFRVNEAFDTEKAILELGTGEAVISFLQEDGTPSVVQRCKVLPPASRMGAITDAERDQCIKGALLYSKYATAVDPDSAYEFLMRRGLEEQAALEAQIEQAARDKEEAAAAAAAEKEAAAAAKAEEKAAAAAERDYQRELEKLRKEQERAEREAAKAAEKAARDAEKAAAKEAEAKRKAAKKVGSTVAGTVGRELGKTLGGSFGKFGKTLGGNVGASLGRGLLETLFKTK